MGKLKKILTVEDLISFCEGNKMSNFSAKESGYQLCVQIPSTFEIDENSPTRGLMRLKIKVAHTNLNRNGSFISKENMEKAMPSLKNRPLLANIHQLDNGEWDFQAHDVEIEVDENTGEEKVTYIEKQVGSFTEDDPYLEYDEERDIYFVIAYAVIPEEYTMAAEIIRSKDNTTKNSCELIIDSLNYNAKEHYLELEDFYFSASCLLGSRNDGTKVEEGMLGSRADIADFSEKNNSILNYSEDNTKLIETLENLNNTLKGLSNFNIQQVNETEENSKEGGNESVTKFEELLKKYNKTEADVEFNIEGLTDEELEDKFAKAFGEESEVPASDEEGEESKESEKENQEEVSTDEPEDKTEEEKEVKVDEACGGAGAGGKTEKKKKKHSIIVNNKEFELSYDDIQNALWNLVNDTYSEADNCYYGVRVYDEYIVMNDWCNGRYYRQSYKNEEDSISLVGDRIEVYANFLTKEEETALEEMKSNYSSISEKLSSYEAAQLHSQREAILADTKYAVLTEKEVNEEGKEFYKNEAYAKLVSEMDNYSLEELEKEMKSVFADYITSGGQFAYDAKDETPVVTKRIIASSTKKSPSRYGSLFSK